MKTSQLSVVAVNMNIAQVFYSVTYFIFVLSNNTLDVVYYFHKVLQEKQIPGDKPLVTALTRVLTASQRYMRDQTVQNRCFVVLCLHVLFRFV